MAIEIAADTGGRRTDILTAEALAFVEGLEHRFGGRRRDLLARRAERQKRWDAGDVPGFLAETADVRSGDWQVRAVPADLQDRRVEITGPVDRKMMINALNSGAKAFMADFEDSNSPTWDNVIDGQVNLVDAVRGTIELVTPDKEYCLGEETATLLVRPRGWHLVDRHVLVDGEPMSGALLDFGLFMFHNARELADRGSGPYFYLPKLESHLEARLWNDVFVHAQQELGLPIGTIKATVLIETVLAAFEMEEILFELRDHSAGLNAGRWDYIFSCVKTFRRREDLMLPDRGRITMTVPFMRAYTEQLVRACHRRGAHAMGGMAAFIPNRRDPEVTERALEGVRVDKQREAADGFDGTWVAHPDLVETAMGEFDAILGDRPNQVGRLREDVPVDASAILDIRVPGGSITEDGLRLNVSGGVQYVASWLRGTGAAAINNLMEDAATAEISRTQVWQWVHHGAALDDGRAVTAELVATILDEELESLRGTYGDEFVDGGRFAEAAEVFTSVALASDFPTFLTIPAYDIL